MRQLVKAARQWINAVPQGIKAVPQWVDRQWAKGWRVRAAWGAGVVAVLAAVGVSVALLLGQPAQPSRADLIRLVRTGDRTIDAARAGCIVDKMRKSFTATRTEQMLKHTGPRLTPREENLVVTAAVTCSGAPDVKLTRLGR